MSILVEFPEELLVATKEDRTKFSRQVMIYTLGHLYEEGKISAGLGAQILECDRWEFFRILSENGFNVIDYSEDELADEIRTSRELVKHINGIHISPLLQNQLREELSSS
jgi:predicted HTH domain antitoxin